MTYKVLLTWLLICFECAPVFARPDEETTRKSIKIAFAKDHLSKNRHPGELVKCLPKVTLERHPAATYEVPRYYVMIDGVSFYAKVRTKLPGWASLNLGPEQEELQKSDKWLDAYEIHQKDQPTLPKIARFKKHILFTFKEEDWEILVFEAAQGVRITDLLWDVALREYATPEEKLSQMASFGKIGKSIVHFHFSIAPSLIPIVGPFMVHGKLDLYSMFFDSTNGDVTLTNYEELRQTANGFHTETDFQKIFDLSRDFAHFGGRAYDRGRQQYQKANPPKENETEDEKLADLDRQCEWVNAKREIHIPQYKECINALIEGYNSVRLEKGLPAINVKVHY